MSLNSTPSAERTHIGFFGMRNAGKSSVVNAVTGQALSIVSDVKGTTTDPVQKAMELLPLGPVVIIDTPGLDDEGALGEQRVQRAWRELNKCDVAVLVIDAAVGMQPQDTALLEHIERKGVPHLVVFNKSDLAAPPELDADALAVSAKTGDGIHALKERIAALAVRPDEKRVLGDLISPEDVIVLVTPIDSSAPKGRMILPQVQAIRDTLDSAASCVVTQPEQLTGVLNALKAPPKLVVTDSQAFGTVKDLVPESIPLTSFSILFARYKGILETAVDGVRRIAELRNGDTVLISEGCTHHRQCEDIGTVKLPRWLGEMTGRKLNFAFTSGREFPEDLSPYALIVHCGGCMLNEREMRYRRKCAEDQGVPFTNYGTLIAQRTGILRRSLAVLADV